MKKIVSYRFSEETLKRIEENAKNYDSKTQYLEILVANNNVEHSEAYKALAKIKEIKELLKK